MTSQQEADIALDGYRAARDGAWPGDCPVYHDDVQREHWLTGFIAWIDAKLAREDRGSVEAAGGPRGPTDLGTLGFA